VAKDETDGNELSAETIGYLEEVKKGKVRKFAMICKGTSVVNLVVYKKGNVEKRKKEAKEQGKGQFYFGVVDGKGLDLRFVLAREDGFESAPVKSSVLKSFLEEKADLKFKPYFEIVDSAPLTLNEEDPLVARFLSLQNAALQACDRYPDRAAEINALCLKIGKALDGELSEQAAVDLESLEALLGSLGGTTESTSSKEPTGSSQSPSDSTALIAKLSAALEKLRPLISKAGELQSSLQSELTAAFNASEQDLRNIALDQAQTRILELGKRLKEILTGATGTSPTGTSQGTPQSSIVSQEAQDFAIRQKQLEPKLLQAQKASQEKSVALGNVWQHALTQAENGNFAVAIKAFDRLEQAIQGILDASQDKWAEWQKAREQVVGQIRQVATAVAATKDPAAKEVIIQLQAIIKNLNPKPEGSQALAELRVFLNDDLIAAAEEAPPRFGSLQIRQPLLQALQLLEA
jgi:hypothetical protein